jgi:hypothetical protein
MHHKFLIPAIFILVTCARADEPSGTRQLVQQAFTSIENTLAQCQSIEFQSTHQVVETDLYAKTHSKGYKLTGGRTAQFIFQARGDKYWYRRTITELDDGGVRIEDRAYDGKNYQSLNHQLASLGFSKFDPDKNHFQLGSLNPLDIFGFLLPQVQGNAPSIRWTTVKNAQAWNACFAAAQYVEPAVCNGKPCIVVKIPCVLNNWVARGPCIYTVYFSVKDGFFPLLWKLQNQNGRLLEDYQIDEFGKAPASKDGLTFFYYPKKATSHRYAEDPKYPADAPESIITTETTLFQLNTIGDDTMFTIDPVKAGVKETVDFDRNVATPVAHQQ